MPAGLTRNLDPRVTCACTFRAELQRDRDVQQANQDTRRSYVYQVQLVVTNETQFKTKPTGHFKTSFDFQLEKYLLI